MKADFVPIVRDAYLEQRNGGYIPFEDKINRTASPAARAYPFSRAKSPESASFLDAVNGLGYNLPIRDDGQENPDRGL
jgi:hypothetical protein